MRTPEGGCNAPLRVNTLQRFETESCVYTKQTVLKIQLSKALLCEKRRDKNITFIQLDNGLGSQCLCERSLMRTLEGGCSAPLGVETLYNEQDDILTVTGKRALLLVV